MGFWGDFGKIILKEAEKSYKKKREDLKRQEEQEQATATFDSMEEMVQAAENGNIDAIEELATISLSQMDFDEAVYWGRKGAIVQNAWCMHVLGEVAFHQRDFYTAEQWFTRNININAYPLSAVELGTIYLNLQEIPEVRTDIDRAEYYFQLALKWDSSNPEAAYGLITCMLAKEEYGDDPEYLRSLLKLACRSENHEIKEQAREMLNDLESAMRS